MIRVKNSSAVISFDTEAGTSIELVLSSWADIEQQLNAIGYTLGKKAAGYKEYTRTLCRCWENGMQTDDKHAQLRKLVTRLKKDVLPKRRPMYSIENSIENQTACRPWRA